MWNSIHKFGVSDKEIQEIADRLIKEEKEGDKPNCHDCDVEPGKQHEENCDVARCSTCGGQRLSCDCEDGGEDIWTGIWPGTIEALEQNLICCWGDTKEWRADLNELAIRRVMKS